MIKSIEFDLWWFHYCASGNSSKYKVLCCGTLGCIIRCILLEDIWCILQKSWCDMLWCIRLNHLVHFADVVVHFAKNNGVFS